MRTPALRRSFLFAAGADANAHAAALAARPDVLIQDLEDFTPDHLKEAACRQAAALYAEARRTGIIAAVRINSLESRGTEDLKAVIPAGPELVLLPKAVSAMQIAALARELDGLERIHGMLAGKIEIVPTIETAAGVMHLAEIVRASARVKSALLGAEDLASDLLAERSPEAEELAYARSRFLLEARALSIEPIDAPYTFSEIERCERESRRSRRLGYRSKSAVLAAQVAVIHQVFTPGNDEIASAIKIVHAFEVARAEGRDRPLVDGLWIEPPAYFNAKRLLERAHMLESLGKEGGLG